MTEAERAITDLDAELAACGEDVELQRLTGTQLIPFKVRCRAFVRALRPEELAGAVNQTIWSVILSPTQIIEAQWPGGQPATPNPMSDLRVPRATQDKVIFIDRDRRELAISSAHPVYLDGELVRINLLVNG